MVNSSVSLDIPEESIGIIQIQGEIQQIIICIEWVSTHIIYLRAIQLAAAICVRDERISHGILLTEVV